MDPISIITLVARWYPAIQSIITAATSNQEIVDRIKTLSEPLAELLEGVGGSLFPEARSQLHIAAGVLASFNPDLTIWAQSALNIWLTETKSATPQLMIDGIYGPRTRAAAKEFQTASGLTADGWVGQMTGAALDYFLAKRPSLA